MRKVLIAAMAVVVLGLLAVAASMGVAAAQGEEGPVQSFIARVAEKLGVSEEELRTAIKEAHEEAIDEAVAQGRLSPEGAERLKERIEEGRLLRPHVRHNLHVVVCQRAPLLIVRSAATILDMEVGELLGELGGNKSLAQVAEQESLSGEEFKAALLDQVQEELDSLVEKGNLTQGQADAIFGRVQENIDGIVNAHRPHPRP